MKKNILREKMEKGEYIIGTQMFMGSKYCAEIMGNLDYDFIFVCAEHTPMGTDNIYDIVKTLEYSGTPSLVRLPIFDLTYTKKVLDMGQVQFYFLW